LVVALEVGGVGDEEDWYGKISAVSRKGKRGAIGTWG
jgi:hypothetical protein